MSEGAFKCPICPRGQDGDRVYSLMGVRICGGCMADYLADKYVTPVSIGYAAKIERLVRELT